MKLKLKEETRRRENSNKNYCKNKNNNENKKERLLFVLEPRRGATDVLDHGEDVPGTRVLIERIEERVGLLSVLLFPLE